MSNNFYNKDNYVPSRPFSEIIYDVSSVKDFLGIMQEDDYDTPLLTIIMDATASYIENFTQMSREELDKCYESSLIFLLMVSDSYNNRTISLSTGNNGVQNRMFTRMLVQMKQNWL